MDSKATPTSHDSRFESLLNDLLYCPINSMSPSDAWQSIKEQVQQLNGMHHAQPRSVAHRVFNIVKLIDNPVGWDHDADQYRTRGRTIYQDAVQCCLSYQPHLLNDLLRKIEERHLDPFSRIVIWSQLSEVLPCEIIIKPVKSTLSQIRTKYFEDQSYTVANQSLWNEEFWDELLNLLRNIQIPMKPWIDILKNITHFDASNLVWQYQLVDNFYLALGSLKDLELESRDIKLAVAACSFYDHPARFWFLLNEITSLQLRCDTGIGLLDIGFEVSEEYYWVIYDWVHDSDSHWYNYGVLLVYGLQYNVIDNISIEFTRTQMNTQFGRDSINYVEEELQHSKALLDEWNSMALMAYKP